MQCGKPLEDDREEYCPDCSRKRHIFDQGRALFSYQGVIRESLYRFKYANKREYAHVYAQEMAGLLCGWIRQKKITRIVPVPLHPSRQRKRGYNQAAVLAKELGKILNLPVDENLLFRTRKTEAQKQLSQKARFRNLKGAFAAKELPGETERILLIDDIYTTGSTADAAADALKRRGNCRVFILTVAAGG